MSQQNYLSIRLENVPICFINVVAFSLSFALEKKSFPEKNVSTLWVSENGCEYLVGNNVLVSLLLLAVWMGCVYEGEWCKSSSKFILPFSRLQWGVEIYGPYYSNYLQVMSSKSQLGMSLWLVKTSHLPLKAFSYRGVKDQKQNSLLLPKKSLKLNLLICKTVSRWLLIKRCVQYVRCDDALSQDTFWSAKYAH